MPSDGYLSAGGSISGRKRNTEINRKESYGGTPRTVGGPGFHHEKKHNRPNTSPSTDMGHRTDMVHGKPAKHQSHYGMSASGKTQPGRPKTGGSGR
jgi:hypothetical protein